jgi:hypothetical protein
VNSYANGQIKDVKLFNRELSAAEVTTLYNEGQLGLEDQWGGGLGDTYTSDFSAGVDGFYDNQATVAGNIDSIGGQDDNLRLTVNTVNTSHYAQKAAFSANKRYRTSFDYYIPSTNSHVDGLEFWIGAAAVSGEAHSPSLDTWLSISGEGISNNTTLYVYVTDGGSRLVNDAGGDDVIYIRNVIVTQIGTLVDIRAENFDTDTGKAYDISDNAFVGVNSGATLIGRKYPFYETGTWTPSITFGGGSTVITYSVQEGHYTRVGNLCHITGYILLSSQGSDTGTLDIAGLNFISKDVTVGHQGFQVGIASGMAGLTSSITGIFLDNATTIRLYDWGATGSATLTEANCSNTSELRFSGTYQIQ